VASLFVAVMTSMGALGVLLARNPERMEESVLLLDIGMGFSSGVMIVASFTSLLLPAIELAGFWQPIAGFIVGGYPHLATQ
jgi:ZIP family zinc transporter